MLKRLVQHRLFSFADLICVSAGIVLWEMRPVLGWEPLLIALLPWLLRLAAGCFPFMRTGFELPVAIFLLTAVIGIWAAYGQDDARSKFWLLVGGVLLYYSLAAQPQGNLWGIAGFLSLIGVGIACFFLLTNDWQLYPAKVNLLNRVGLRWMEVRPALRIEGMHPNSAGAVIAMTTPFLVAVGIKAWREKRILAGLWPIVGGCLTAAGFLLATSRWAALALAVGMGIWLLWVASSQIPKFIPGRPKKIFSVALISLTILAAGFVLAYPGGPTSLANSLPGPPNAGSRVELIESTLKLIGDFPFTGGGLHSFPGLFPYYIRGIPFYITINSHNVYLDVALEQGIIGLLAFCFIYLGSLWSIGAKAWKTPSAALVWPAFASLLIVILHGLADNLVYGRWGAVLVFFLPGIAYAVGRSSSRDSAQDSMDGPRAAGFLQSLRYRWPIIMVIVVACAAILIVLYGCRQPLLAAWYADRGAVRMARTELAGFPSGEWTEDFQLEELKPAERLFEQALRHNEGNRTANHRLGLIALGWREFPMAVSYLEKAYQADKGHRGIWKALGYSYVWAGQFDQALVMLRQIPEARDELTVYIWWWGTQDRKDLAERAATMVKQLEAFELLPSLLTPLP